MIGSPQCAQFMPVYLSHCAVVAISARSRTKSRGNNRRGFGPRRDNSLNDEPVASLQRFDPLHRQALLRSVVEMPALPQLQPSKGHRIRALLRRPALSRTRLCGLPDHRTPENAVTAGQTAQIPVNLPKGNEYKILCGAQPGIPHITCRNPPGKRPAVLSDAASNPTRKAVACLALARPDPLNLPPRTGNWLVWPDESAAGKVP